VTTCAVVLGLLSLVLLASPSSFAVEYASQLTAGQSLQAGDSVLSSLGHVQFIFQSDTNAVLYQVGTPYVPVWDYEQGTLNGKPHVGYGGLQMEPLPVTAYPNLGYAHLDMQSDGNLVLIAAHGTAIWASGTAGYPGASLTVQDDARLVISFNGKSIWSSNTDDLPALHVPHPYDDLGIGIYGNDLRCVLLPGETLLQGGFLVSRAYSYSSTYLQTILQSDGNLVQYQVTGAGYAPVWSTLTGILPSSPYYRYAQGPAQPTAFGNRLVMSPDGDAQLINDSQQRLAWESGTSGCLGCYLDAMSYVTVNHQFLPLWNSQDPTASPARLNGEANTGDYLRRVVNEVEYTLILQNDGNLVFYSRPLASSQYTPLWSTITGPIGRTTQLSSLYGPQAIGDSLYNGYGPVLQNSIGDELVVTWELYASSTTGYSTHLQISDQGVLESVIDQTGATLWTYTD
jgi:hypothetical protein